MLNRIKTAIGTHNKGSKSKKFKDFELKWSEAFLCGVGGEGRVFKSTDGRAENENHSQMECRIKDKKDKRFSILHYEAHYEATRNEA